MTIEKVRLAASYRDPAGFIFKKEDRIYRQVNKSYSLHYDHLMSSGLFRHVTDKNLMVSHSEIQDVVYDPVNWYKTLLPEQISFISYPYEWSFDQLKDAALLTLELVKESLGYEMILKDATPFNVQFYNGKSVFIDTLSFEVYEEGKPWVAYRQFCENFLAPLLLMHYQQIEMNKLLQLYPNGIPLQMVASLLPFKARFNMGALLHVYFQSGYKNNSTSNKNASNGQLKLSKNRLLAIIDSLRSTITKLTLKREVTTWENYYSETVLNGEYVIEKSQIINQLLSKIKVKTAIDLGANNGHFSKLLASNNITIVSSDIDPNCINQLYLDNKQKNVTNIQPLIIDLAVPTPAIGWANQERESFWERCNFDLSLSLALIHHLAIGRNISLDQIADQFSKISQYLIIEFVPKSDPKVQILLENREDIFDEYTLEGFERIFQHYYTVIDKQPVTDTHRMLYLLEKKK
jgi:2-polyprenyl-3-methyl-5-hydroxy-6-metoxy-1,4-benzoquinol methylase